jgi:ssDNA-binding Zn-finger/Zn-ribbon topoisomerase 1
MILKILDSILPGSGTIIKKTIKAFEKGINAFVNALKEDWEQLKNPSTESARSSEEVRSDIYEADGEISDLEEKQQYDGGLNNADCERLQELRRQAAELANEHQISRSKETIAEILTDPHKASETTFSQDFIHVLDWSRGPTVREKKCPNCQSPMHLQRNNQSVGRIPTVRDFFWACINYYKPVELQCKGVRPFQECDFGLLHKSGISELEIRSSDFYAIAADEDIQKIALKKMDPIQGAQDIDTVCPIHGLPMISLKKKNPTNALDLWHQKCPHPTCQQTRKLKDLAQLAGLYRRLTGDGILD